MMKCDSCGHELLFRVEESLWYCQGCNFRSVEE
jgi:ribosomal protein L37AE/L43A